MMDPELVPEVPPPDFGVVPLIGFQPDAPPLAPQPPTVAPLEFGAVPELLPAPQAGQDIGTPTFQEPAPVEAIEDRVFEPQPVAPLGLVAERADEVRKAQEDIEARRAEVAAQNLRRAELVRALPFAKGKQVQKLEKAIGQSDRAVSEATRGLEEARAVGEEESAVQEAELGIAAARARQAAVVNAQAEIDRANETADAELAANEAREAEARGQRDESIAGYQRDMDAGPSRSMGIMLADVMAEALNARLEGRPANFGGALARHEKETASIFARQQQANLARVKASGDKIADLAAQRRVLKADKLEQQTAIMDRAIREAERSIAIAQTDAQEAQAMGIRDALAQERDRRAAQAAVARREAMLREEDAAVDRQLKLAKLAKERAAATKTELEAAKLERRMRGGPRAVAAGLVAPNVVAIPGLDRPLVTFPDTKEGRKEAAETRDIVVDQQRLLNVINGLEAEYEDLDKQGLLGSLGLEGSKTNERWQAKRSIAAARLAQIKAGPGKATTAADEDWAENFLPKNPSAWANKSRGLRQLKAARNEFDEEVRTVLQRTTRLDKQARESVVRRSRVHGIGQTDVARQRASVAGQTVADESKPVAERVKAVELLEENARQGPGDWLERATASTVEALDAVQEPEVRRTLENQLAKYEGYAADREAQLGILGIGRKLPQFKTAKDVQTRIDEYKKKAAERLANKILQEPELGMPGESIRRSVAEAVVK